MSFCVKSFNAEPKQLISSLLSYQLLKKITKEKDGKEKFVKWEEDQRRDDEER